MSNDLIRHKYYFMSSWKCLDISGRDSVDFLNRLLTLDVRLMALNTGSWSFLLDHRGRVIEVLFLLRVNKEKFIAVSETGVESLYESLDHFFFSESLQLTMNHQYQCIYVPTHMNIELHSQVYRMDIFGLSDEFLLLVEQQTIDTFLMDLETQGFAELTQAQFETLRVNAGGALPSREYQNVSPLDVSLKGITEGKGCYPGQEVIERTLALGKPAKLTLKMKITGSLACLKELLTMLKDGTQLTLAIDSESKAQGLNHSSLKTCGVLTSMAWPTMDGDQITLADGHALNALAQVKRSTDRTLNVYILINGSIYDGVIVSFT